MKPFSFKAVLFDADGTLYDSTMLHFEAYKKVSHELYNFEFTEKIFFDECIDLYKKPTQVLREHGVKCADKDFYEKKNPYYHEIAAAKLKPTKNLIPFLNSIKSQNIPCHIVSGATKSSLETSLTILGIQDFFDCKVTYEDSPKRQKPDPYPYKLALKKIGLNPDDCIVFEDTKSGIESAKNAEIVCIGIKNETNSEISLHDADLVVSDFNQLHLYSNKGHSYLTIKE